MKINKDLVDAIMMLAFIMLVLIGTTDFTNVVAKYITMGALGLTAIVMVTLRGIQMRQEAKEPKHEYEY